jgi:hypothetical protein
VLDARLSKRFTVHEGYQLELLAEAFNVLNHQNVTAVNTTVYSLRTAKNPATGLSYNTLSANTSNGVFGAPNNSNNNNIYSPRQIQLGARFHF